MQQLGKGLNLELDVAVEYYRLSGYWYIFKHRNSAGCDDPENERFIPGTTFDQLWRLYIFDRQFHLLVLDAIERVGVYSRVHLAYRLAEEMGAFGYLSNDSLPRLSHKNCKDFITHCREQYDRSREPFVRHSKKLYSYCEELPPY